MKNTVRLLAAASLAALSAPAMAQQPAAAAEASQVESVPEYTARQFFETTSYGMASPAGIGFSPDGSQLLISSDADGVYNAWLLPVAGGDPVPVTRSTDNATFAVSFFPSDGRILYTADEGGNELNHVHVRAEDGTVTDLTPGENVKAQFEGWSNDGGTLYISTNERDPQMFDLYAYDAGDYERRMVFENTGGFGLGAVSRDGRHVALVKERTSADNNLYLAAIGENASEPRLITEHTGNISHGVYDFTPDGATLIYATDEHGEFTQAWTYDIAGGETAPLIEAEWDVSFVTPSPSGRYRVSAVNADAQTQLTITDTETGAPIALTGIPEGDLGSVRFDRDESRIAFTVSSDTSPSDIFVADLASGEARRLTSALNPAIVLVHGGPGGQSRRGYSPMVQHLVNHGYAVYAINNRGSSGYGKTFFHMDDRRHGDADLRDVVASKDFLQGLDWIADDRIAVAGGSYGGFMTAAALAFHPEVFDAGINIFGVTNWVRTLESIPPYWEAFREALFDEMGDPATDAERHRAISPLFHAGNIAKPMLVIQGANDPRVLQVESDELVEAARANGVPVEYVLFPDEGHGFLRKENRITASEAYLEFLEEHIGSGRE
ncbi:MAG: alpha/beta fold hydrolase [Parasphingopyxis sp.]